MKKCIAFMTFLTIIVSCGRSGDHGELVGVKGKRWHPEKPYGMALVPGGSYIMGKSDEDVAGVGDANTKTVTVRSFYMDETEITNSEYRQFVEWVKDSIIRTKLAEAAEFAGVKAGEGKGKKERSIADYAFVSMDSTSKKKVSAYDMYMYDNMVVTKDGRDYSRRLNRNVKLAKGPQDYPDKDYVEAMEEMYLPMEESYNGLRSFDVKQLRFMYAWMDIQAAAKSKNGERSDFVHVIIDPTDEKEGMKVYPDTTVWIKDFAYSYNEPMHNDYFWHKAYGEYPVVGVRWEQAKAFCAWRTLYKNIYIKQKKKGYDQVNNFRLPTEAEWEYAARGGLQSAKYPWGGPYTKSERGCFMANFKPNRGDYAADEALYTVEANSYEPNGYNLYNMAGNVAEWTDTSYDPNAYEYVSTMNPNVLDNENKRKVVRGGSWKDVAYFLQVGTRDFEYKDSARSFIGFRTVQDYMGTQNTGNTTRRNR